MSSTAVSVRGKVKELGYERIPALFEKNPYMHQIYPTEDAIFASNRCIACAAAIV